MTRESFRRPGLTFNDHGKLVRYTAVAEKPRDAPRYLEMSARIKTTKTATFYLSLANENKKNCRRHDWPYLKEDLQAMRLGVIWKGAKKVVSDRSRSKKLVVQCPKGAGGSKCS